MAWAGQSKGLACCTIRHTRITRPTREEFFSKRKLLSLIPERSLLPGSRRTCILRIVIGCCTGRQCSTTMRALQNVAKYQLQLAQLTELNFAVNWASSAASSS
eukprot:2993893-Pleurochrysis_carterae.AAC.10